MAKEKKLVLECKAQPDQTGVVCRIGQTKILVAPLLAGDYWLYRVRLTKNQAIVGFPKFGTIGIGFAREADWNTNLPYDTGASEIFEHIRHNKGRGNIRDEDCIRAIKMIQEAVLKNIEGA